jgi:excisionase family DNA binding protein
MQGGMMPREGVLGQATRIDPVPADHEALDSLSAREDLGGGELVLRTADGTEISLPSSLLRLVVSAANNLAAGRAVMAIPAEVMLTPTEAAELLGLSRPFVARLLERGDIPSELLPESRHRRIKLGDVLAFQDRRERRSEGRSRIADIAATADLPYLCLLFVARVFIDTNVLFPFSVMDLMLALTEDGIHDVMWSDDLLDEWERVIVRERHRSPDAAAAITATIRQFFADTRIPAQSYQGLVAEADGPTPTTTRIWPLRLRGKSNRWLRGTARTSTADSPGSMRSGSWIRTSTFAPSTKSSRTRCSQRSHGSPPASAARP